MASCTRSRSAHDGPEAVAPIAPIDDNDNAPLDEDEPEAPEAEPSAVPAVLDARASSKARVRALACRHALRASE